MRIAELEQSLAERQGVDGSMLIKGRIGIEKSMQGFSKNKAWILSTQSVDYVNTKR